MSTTPTDSAARTEGPAVGKIFAIGIALLCLMVASGVFMMFLSAKSDAANRAKHPVIGQP